MCVNFNSSSNSSTVVSAYHPPYNGIPDIFLIYVYPHPNPANSPLLGQCKVLGKLMKHCNQFSHTQ